MASGLKPFGWHINVQHRGKIFRQLRLAVISQRVLLSELPRLDMKGPETVKRSFERCGRCSLMRRRQTGGASVVQPWVRFHILLIEPDKHRRSFYSIHTSVVTDL